MWSHDVCACLTSIWSEYSFPDSVGDPSWSMPRSSKPSLFDGSSHQWTGSFYDKKIRNSQGIQSLHENVWCDWTPGPYFDNIVGYYWIFGNHGTCGISWTFIIWFLTWDLWQRSFSLSSRTAILSRAFLCRTLWPSWSSPLGVGDTGVNDMRHCHVQRKNRIPAEWP